MEEINEWSNNRIRVGKNYQATIPDLLEENSSADNYYTEREQCIWKNDDGGGRNGLTDEDINNYCQEANTEFGIMMDQVVKLIKYDETKSLWGQFFGHNFENFLTKNSQIFNYRTNAILRILLNAILRKLLKIYFITTFRISMKKYMKKKEFSKFDEFWKKKIKNIIFIEYYEILFIQNQV